MLHRTSSLYQALWSLVCLQQPPCAVLHCTLSLQHAFRSLVNFWHLPCSALCCTASERMSDHILVSLQAGSLPECARLACARLSLPPSHAACCGSDVQDVLQQQQHLAASLQAGTAALRLDEQSVGLGASSDLSQLFSACLQHQHQQVTVTVSSAQQPQHAQWAIPGICCVSQDPRSSFDDSTLGMLCWRHADAAVHHILVLIPLSEPSGQPQLLDLGSLPDSARSQLRARMEFAPSADLACAVVNTHTNPDEGRQQARMVIHRTDGTRVAERQICGDAPRIMWSPDSKYIAWLDCASISCFEVSTGIVHSCASGIHQQPAWVQLPAGEPQRLVLGRYRELVLFTAPEMSQPHKHAVTFKMGQQSLQADAVYKCSSHASRLVGVVVGSISVPDNCQLHVYRVEPELAACASCPRICLQHVLPLQAGWRSYALSPDGCFVATTIIGVAAQALAVHALDATAPQAALFAMAVPPEFSVVLYLLWRSHHGLILLSSAAQELKPVVARWVCDPQQ